MKLTKVQHEVLHILWASDTPLSVQGIAEKSKYRLVGRLIISIAIENLLAKNAVYQAGFSHCCLNKKENILVLYAATVRFDEYYVEQFQNITPINIFNLIGKMLQSNKLSPKQLRELSALLDGK